MRRGGIILSSLLLSGCATAFNADYTPQTIGQPSKPDLFASDVAFCTNGGKLWKPQPSTGDILQAGADGGADAASYAILYPYMPVLGALGQSGKSAVNGYDLTGHAKRNVQRHCVEDMVRLDGSAIVARPED